MFADRLIAGDAIKRIKSVTQNGDRVLGVDGFRVTHEGFVAVLDLIIDLSAKTISRERAAAEAIEFVVSRGANGVVFEAVVEHRANGG